MQKTFLLFFFLFTLLNCSVLDGVSVLNDVDHGEEVWYCDSCNCKDKENKIECVGSDCEKYEACYPKIKGEEVWFCDSCNCEDKETDVVVCEGDACDGLTQCGNLSTVWFCKDCNCQDIKDAQKCEEDECIGMNQCGGVKKTAWFCEDCNCKDKKNDKVECDTQAIYGDNDAFTAEEILKQQNDPDACFNKLIKCFGDYEPIYEVWFCEQCNCLDKKNDEVVCEGNACKNKKKDEVVCEGDACNDLITKCEKEDSYNIWYCDKCNCKDQENDQQVCEGEKCNDLRKCGGDPDEEGGSWYCDRCNCRDQENDEKECEGDACKEFTKCEKQDGYDIWYCDGCNCRDEENDKEECEGQGCNGFRKCGGIPDDEDEISVEKLCEQAPKLMIFKVETRKYKGSIESTEEEYSFAKSLKNTFLNEADAEKEGYCEIESPIWPISNSKKNGCPNGKKKNIMWSMDLQFFLPFDLEVNVDFGLDMGNGVGIFLNGEPIFEEKSDLWWKRNWDHKDVVSISREYKKGVNQLTVYGSEGCCDGFQSMRVQLGENQEILGQDYGDQEIYDLTNENWESLLTLACEEVITNLIEGDAQILQALNVFLLVSIILLFA